MLGDAKEIILQIFSILLEDHFDCFQMLKIEKHPIHLSVKDLKAPKID